uniref:Core-2/I-Branching enzyme n=1 Tax=Parascaris univalens TaxID=6257 RepID=A0A915CG68_PARUN
LSKYELLIRIAKESIRAMRMSHGFFLIILVALFFAVWMLAITHSVSWIVIFELPQQQFVRTELTSRKFEEFSRNGFRFLTNRPNLNGVTTLPIVRNTTISDEDCQQVLDDPSYANQLPTFTIANGDIIDASLSTSCNEIRKRGRYAKRSLSEEESEFPIAFARIVYKDYHLQELLLNVMYAPQNVFCYAIDEKASPLFYEQMTNLSQCFPNVFLTDRHFNVDSAGHNTTRSFLECLHLLRAKPAWKYAILLQNNDIPLKTNYETVEILKALNGSNDINVGPPNKNRIPQNLSWTYQALNLFKGEVSLISSFRSIIRL